MNNNYDIITKLKQGQRFKLDNTPYLYNFKKIKHTYILNAIIPDQFVKEYRGYSLFSSRTQLFVSNFICNKELTIEICLQDVSIIENSYSKT